jgi:hypothetical protein
MRSLKREGGRCKRLGTSTQYLQLQHLRSFCLTSVCHTFISFLNSISFDQPLINMMNNVNSPDISLDMNLDSPSADVADGCADVHGGEGGDGMNENDNNIIHRGTRHNDTQQHEQDSRYREIRSSGIGGDDNYSFNDGVTNSGGNGGGGGGAKKIDCDKMTKTMEEWKDELSMMRVKNAILLDDLVKVGATNVV